MVPGLRGQAGDESTLTVTWPRQEQHQRWIWCIVSSPRSITSKTTKVLEIALLEFVSGHPGECQPGTGYEGLEAPSLR